MKRTILDTRTHQTSLAAESIFSSKLQRSHSSKVSGAAFWLQQMVRNFDVNLELSIVD